MKRISILFVLLLAGLVFSVTGASASSPAPFFNGFETNNAGWNVFGGLNDATRVASGTNGVTSKTGAYHAEASQCALDTCGGSAATDWGGYTDTFPASGYSTSVDIYLNVGGAYANDARFDWDSAISDRSGGFRRDFVFNCGYYDDSDVTGTGPRFVCSASNNAGRSGAYPKNPGRSPFTITTGGWYTFQHTFYDAGSGVLAADLSILDSSGNLLKTWTLSDSSDVIGTTVGGNRYGWFASQEFPFLAFDNSQLNVAPTCTATGLVRDGIDLTAAVMNPTSPVTGTIDATGCNIGVYFGPGTTGSVTGAEIYGANYYGVVANAASVDVTSSQIHDIGENPLNGTQHGVGVLYTTIDQSGTTTGSSATGTLSGSTITNYQKNGIVVSGVGAAATILNNTVTGQGQIDWIAQNGIQISFGGTGLIRGNTVSGNWYTPKSYVACGLLFYQANGVKQQSNNMFGNEMNLCNVGRGGGNFNP